MGRTVVLLVLLTVLLSCAGTAFATPSALPDPPPNAKVVFEAQEITDPEVLLQRAKAGITDYPGDEKEVLASITGPPGAALDRLVTTQKIKETRWDNGGRTRYVTTAICRVWLPESSADGQISPLATDDVTDPSLSWTLYLTFTYEVDYDASLNRYGKILNVKGKWQRHDSTVTCSSAYLRAACNGKRLDGGYNMGEKLDKPIGYPSSGYTYDFTSSVFSGWDYTFFQNADGETSWGCYIVGAGRSTLTRGGSTWYLDLDIYKGNLGDDWGFPR